MSAATTIRDAQYDALELSRQEKFVANGHSGEITLLKSVNGAQVSHLIINRAWDYGERDSDGRLLPPDVQYELRIAESLLTAADLKIITGIQEGDIIYQIELPSPFPPQALRRFYRFWISPQEDAN